METHLCVQILVSKDPLCGAPQTYWTIDPKSLQNQWGLGEPFWKKYIFLRTFSEFDEYSIIETEIFAPFTTPYCRPSIQQLTNILLPLPGSVQGQRDGERGGRGLLQGQQPHHGGKIFTTNLSCKSSKKNPTSVYLFLFQTNNIEDYR